MTRPENELEATDAKYSLRHTHSGYAVIRRDGGYAEFLDRAEAEEAATSLASGNAIEDDYEWRADH